MSLAWVWMNIFYSLPRWLIGNQSCTSQRTEFYVISLKITTLIAPKWNAYTTVFTVKTLMIWSLEWHIAGKRLFIHSIWVCGFLCSHDEISFCCCCCCYTTFGIHYSLSETIYLTNFLLFNILLCGWK